MKRSENKWNQTKTRTSSTQSANLPQSLRQTLGHDSKRAKEIDQAIATFIDVDMKLFSVVHNARFQNMLRVLETQYKISSQTIFTNLVVPASYYKTKVK